MSIRLLAIRDLHERYGHIQEVIVQNFRVKSTIPMAHWPEPSHGEMLRTVAVARLLLPNVNIQAPPNLSAPYYDDLMDAGINDWGGISPLTPDFIIPRNRGRTWSNSACALRPKDSSCSSVFRCIRNLSLRSCPNLVCSPKDCATVPAEDGLARRAA